MDLIFEEAYSGLDKVVTVIALVNCVLCMLLPYSIFWLKSKTRAKRAKNRGYFALGALKSYVGGR